MNRYLFIRTNTFKCFTTTRLCSAYLLLVQFLKRKLHLKLNKIVRLKAFIFWEKLPIFQFCFTGEKNFDGKLDWQTVCQKMVPLKWEVIKFPFKIYWSEKNSS